MNSIMYQTEVMELGVALLQRQSQMNYDKPLPVLLFRILTCCPQWT